MLWLVTVLVVSRSCFWYSTVPMIIITAIQVGGTISTDTAVIYNGPGGLGYRVGRHLQSQFRLVSSKVQSIHRYRRLLRYTVPQDGSVDQELLTILYLIIFLNVNYSSHKRDLGTMQVCTVPTDLLYSIVPSKVLQVVIALLETMEL